MGNERLCGCGSVADWKEIGSTWMCVACRDKDIRKNIAEFRETLAHMERTEKALSMFKVDTMAIPELLGKLKDEINKISV